MCLSVCICCVQYGAVRNGSATQHNKYQSDSSTQRQMSVYVRYSSTGCVDLLYIETETSLLGIDFIDRIKDK